MRIRLISEVPDRSPGQDTHVISSIKKLAFRQAAGVLRAETHTRTRGSKMYFQLIFHMPSAAHRACHKQTGAGRQQTAYGGTCMCEQFHDHAVLMTLQRAYVLRAASCFHSVCVQARTAAAASSTVVRFGLIFT
jgi:hypothetical protein